MYFNNVHIMVYVFFLIVGFIVGKLVAWANIRLPEDKKFFSKEYFKENNENKIKNSYIMMFITAILYIALLYRFGIKATFIQNLDLIKFLLLMPMLISAFFIDLKHRIIPNRLNMTIFEIGLLLTFIYGIFNLNIAKDMLLGMLTGASIFLGITLLGALVYGKEAMGLGDVKFMGAIGLYYGYSTIAEIALLAFIIGAIISVIIVMVRTIFLKSQDEYMPFGPFLVISAIGMIFIPANTIFLGFITVCGSISDKLLSIGIGEE